MFRINSMRKYKKGLTSFGHLIIIIIIITSFQEDNIFGHVFQSNIWSLITKAGMSLTIEQTSIIFSMYRASEVSVHRA